MQLLKLQIHVFLNLFKHISLLIFNFTPYFLHILLNFSYFLGHFVYNLFLFECFVLLIYGKLILRIYYLFFDEPTVILDKLFHSVESVFDAFGYCLLNFHVYLVSYSVYNYGRHYSFSYTHYNFIFQS